MNDNKDNMRKKALEQFNLGNSLAKKGNLEQARKHWESITREDHVEAYVMAQRNLGNSFDQEGKVEQARKYWENITREDHVEAYVKAQYNLGNSLAQAGKIELARKHWENITRRDHKETYAMAQLNLGNSFYKEGKIEQARKYWDNMTREDNVDMYARAQFNLGFSFVQEGKVDLVCKHWNNIIQADNVEVYVKAQYNLGNLFAKKGELEQSWDYHRNILGCNISYIRDSYINDLIVYHIKQVTKFKLKNEKDIKELNLLPSLSQIKVHVDNIYNELYINPEKKIENRFAHYTSIQVAELIMNNGSFQMGVANHMNDPFEGKVLLNEWDIPLEYNDSFLGFLTSFTFNENSLNQFRLYGKTNNEEGTGISLVIANSFFSDKFNPEQAINLNMNALFNDYQQVSNISNISNTEGGGKKDKQLPSKFPLFRCVYMNPETDYINVAHMNKLSFFLNAVSETLEDEWNVYLQEMDGITNKVRKELEKIKTIIKKVMNAIRKNDFSDYDEIYQAIATTLLPIIYLTKHAAFEEEAECRILYMTTIFDQNIKRDGERVYVEYATKVNDGNYLEKIYLGPKADPKADVNLKKCWIDKMREKGIANNDIKIPTIKKSTLPLA